MTTKIPPEGNPIADRTSEQCRLDAVVDVVRQISLQTDPQAMVSMYRRRSAEIHGFAHSLSLSRRGLNHPHFRITRSTTWTEEINPWKQPDRLPLLSGGILAELIYGDEPRLLHGVTIGHDDPAHAYLRDARAIQALPIYDEGVALNMVVRYAPHASAFDHADFPEAVLRANLFGRATKTLVLSEALRRKNEELDRELQRVAEIQRSLLPARLPRIPDMDLAVSYETAARAGGDYYDFFDLGQDRWGIVMADASGHGTPAAVLMAILRTILHASRRAVANPAAILELTNRQLCLSKDGHDGSFITAFYAILDARRGEMIYSCAGHPPPLRVVSSTEVHALDAAQSLPLGVAPGCDFDESSTTILPGNTLLLYTDGVTEAPDPSGRMYGMNRLLECVCEDAPNAQHIVDCVRHRLLAHSGGAAPWDDRTLLAMRATGKP